MIRVRGLCYGAGPASHITPSTRHEKYDEERCLQRCRCVVGDADIERRQHDSMLLTMAEPESDTNKEKELPSRTFVTDEIQLWIYLQDDLVAYAKEHGHLRVSKTDTSRLQVFLQYLRWQYVLYQETPWRSCLMKEYIELLNGYGMEWDIDHDKSLVPQSPDPSWSLLDFFRTAERRLVMRKLS